ncbi:DUF881 domain-containing protein [Parafrankia discariae]|uniref:DUF881 domain-containing protein n=1 Tax=Parafrankia discariae TaxID=365528 RepID=UPI00037D90F8|nr:DUF881 domain-containing protein [Parafrankia discariae]
MPAASSAARRAAGRRAAGWRIALVGLVVACAALLTAAAVRPSAGGRAGGAGVVSVAGLVAQDRRRVDSDLDRLRTERDALAADPASAAASPGPSTTPAPASPTPGDPLDRRAALAAQVGLTALRGPAVTVELDDAPRESRGRSLPPGVPPPGPNDLVVHQQDVQAVVNALWAGGAEAMAIMDHRVTPRTAVRCVGNTLLLEGQVYSPPFRISAIGDPDLLRAALDTDPGVLLYREYVDAYGLGYQVTSGPDVVLPAYTGSLLTGAGAVAQPGTG